MRKAKILATLGPVSRDPATIEALIMAGANGVRINMSHGTHADKEEDIKNLSPYSSISLVPRYEPAN